MRLCDYGHSCFVPVSALLWCRTPRARALAASQLTRPTRLRGPAPQVFEPAVLRLRDDPSTAKTPPRAIGVWYACLHAHAVSRDPHAPLPIDLLLTAPAWPLPTSARAAFKRSLPAD